jgi:hypothetical protein
MIQMFVEDDPPVRVSARRFATESSSTYANGAGRRSRQPSSDVRQRETDGSKRAGCTLAPVLDLDTQERGPASAISSCVFYLGACVGVGHVAVEIAPGLNGLPDETLPFFRV